MAMGSGKVALTEDAVRVLRLPPGKIDATVWDASIGGFGIRLRPTKRAWVIVYRTKAGTLRKLQLGLWPGMSAKKAREQARIQLGAAAAGADPAADRRVQRQAGTVRELLQRFLAEHARVRCKPSTIERYEWLVEKAIVPRIGALATADVTAADVADFHRRTASTPRSANQAVAILSKAFNLAEAWRLRPQHTNPCRHLRRFAEAKRDRVPVGDEYARLAATLAELEAEGKIATRIGAAIRLLAFTGCRLSEVLGLRWRNVDLVHGRLRLEDAKAGARDVPIGAVSAALIEALDAGEPDDLVFTLDGTLLHRWAVQKAWRKVCARAKVEGLRLHDLRHGVGTMTALSGANAFQVKAKLGQRTLLMAQRYVNRVEDHLGKLSDTVENKIAAAMAGKSAKVDNLADRRVKTRAVV